VQHAMNTVWAVPRNVRRNPLAARVRGLLLLTTAGLAVLGTTVLSVLGGTQHCTYGSLTRRVLLVAWVALNCVIFLVVFRLAPARRLSWADVVPGVVAAAIFWQ
jgi:membrane protein